MPGWAGRPIEAIPTPPGLTSRAEVRTRLAETSAPSARIASLSPSSWLHSSPHLIPLVSHPSLRPGQPNNSAPSPPPPRSFLRPVHSLACLALGLPLFPVPTRSSQPFLSHSLLALAPSFLRLLSAPGPVAHTLDSPKPLVPNLLPPLPSRIRNPSLTPAPSPPIFGRLHPWKQTPALETPRRPIYSLCPIAYISRHIVPGTSPVLASKLPAASIRSTHTQLAKPSLAAALLKPPHPLFASAGIVLGACWL